MDGLMVDGLWWKVGSSISPDNLASMGASLMIRAAAVVVGVGVGAGVGHAVVVVPIDFGPSTAIPLPTGHFWESTGWCPPLPLSEVEDYWTQEALMQNHMAIASVPHQGIKQVRIHSLLTLLKPLDPSGGGVAADWAPDLGALAANVSGGVWFGALDAAMDSLHGLGLGVGFELMGNPIAPSGELLFSSFGAADEIALWHALAVRRGVGRRPPWLPSWPSARVAGASSGAAGAACVCARRTPDASRLFITLHPLSPSSQAELASRYVARYGEGWLAGDGDSPGWRWEPWNEVSHPTRDALASKCNANVHDRRRRGALSLAL